MQLPTPAGNPEKAIEGGLCQRKKSDTKSCIA